MRYLLFILFLPLFSFAQVKFNETKFDLGEIEVNSPRFVDCEVFNSGAQAHYILSVKTPREVTYIHQGSLLKPNDGLTLRIQANPRSKGKFSYEVLVYTSNQQTPTKIIVKGNVKSLPKRIDNNFTRCPAFGTKSQDQITAATSFEMTVLVRDSITKEPLHRSEVLLLQRGKEIAYKKTDRNGESTQTIPLGYTYFYAAHPDYKSKEQGNYVNFKRNYIIIDLTRSKETPEEETIVENTPEIIQEENATPIEEELIVETTEENQEEEPITIELEVVGEEELEEEEIVINIGEENNPDEEFAEQIDEEIPIEEEVSEEIVKEKPKSSQPKFDDIDSNNFSEEYFQPNNIVFVIDVSSSMRTHDKLELMKYSLFQLTDMLRPIDQIALVSYSSDVEVLLSSTSGENKDSIKAKVEGMEASGFTSGGEAIKIGFKEAQDNYIANGNNQVIIITDGSFNRNSNNYKRYIRRYKRLGINLSVVGIKNSTSSRIEMQKASELGEGTYVDIENLLDARNNLKQAIRQLSFKY